MRKVLVADSANITHFVLERILGKHECDIHYVKFPRDLIQKLRDLQPDVLFLEPEISGGKGKRIVDYLAKQVDLSMPIILMTRISEIEKYGMDVWPGVHAVIRKPLNSQKVLDAVESLPVPQVQGLRKAN